MNKPTRQEIIDVIAKLKGLKLKVTQYTFFGDSNRKAIQAQIDVLNDGMDEDAIYERWDEGESDSYERNHALQALQWMNGEPIEDSEDEGIVESWEGLVPDDGTGLNAPPIQGQ